MSEAAAKTVADRGACCRVWLCRSRLIAVLPRRAFVAWRCAPIHDPTFSRLGKFPASHRFRGEAWFAILESLGWSLCQHRWIQEIPSRGSVVRACFQHRVYPPPITMAKR